MKIGNITIVHRQITYLSVHFPAYIRLLDVQLVVGCLLLIIMMLLFLAFLVSPKLMLSTFCLPGTSSLHRSSVLHL